MNIASTFFVQILCVRQLFERSSDSFFSRFYRYFVWHHHLPVALVSLNIRLEHCSDVLKTSVVCNGPSKMLLNTEIIITFQSSNVAKETKPVFQKSFIL